MKKLIIASAILLASSASLGFATTCNINTMNNGSCTTKIHEHGTASFTIVGVNAHQNYSCDLKVDGSNSQQVKQQGLAGYNGASVSNISRQLHDLYFNVENPSNAIGMVKFQMHSHRKSWGDTNQVTLYCSKTN